MKEPIVTSNNVTLSWYAYGENSRDCKEQGDTRGIGCDNWPKLGQGQFSCWGFTCARGSFSIFLNERHYYVYVKEPNESTFTRKCDITNIPDPSSCQGLPDHTKCTFNPTSSGQYQWYVQAGHVISLSGQNPFYGQQSTPIYSFWFTAPTSTPILTSTPRPTSTPTLTPVSCNHTCDVSVGPYCTSGLACNVVFWDTGLCRNPACRESQNCLCPTPTLTPRPTNTPTPRPAVYGCNAVCQRNSECQTGYCKIITGGIVPGVCRNQNCPTLSDTNCVCPTNTPTRLPTLTLIPTRIPTATATPTFVQTCSGSCKADCSGVVCPAGKQIGCSVMTCSSCNGQVVSCSRSGYGGWTNTICCVQPTSIPTQVRSTPTAILSPTPTMIPRKCEYCRMYDRNWNLLSPPYSIRKGQSVYLSTKEVRNNPIVSIKARFRINDSASTAWCSGTGLALIDGWCETGLKHNDEFYIPYTFISSGRIKVGSMLYNLDSGWY